MGACWGTHEEIWGQTARGGCSLGISFQLHSLLLLRGLRSCLGPHPPTSPPSCDYKAKPPPLCSAADRLVSRHGSKLPRNGNSEMDVKKQGASTPGEVSDLLGWARFRSRPLEAAQCAESGSEHLRLASPSPSKIPGCCMSRGDLTLTVLLFNEQMVLSLKKSHEESNVQDGWEQIPGAWSPLNLHWHRYPSELMFGSHSKL